MPRRNAKSSRRARGSRADPPAPPGTPARRTESWGDTEWLVQPIPGARADKTYRCPGCDHEIRPGTGHVVTWPVDELSSVADRRHWHTGCWAARERRGPTGRRG